MRSQEVDLLSRHFLNQHFVSSQQTVQLLQLMDEVHRDIEATERSIRVRLRNNLMVGAWLVACALFAGSTPARRVQWRTRLRRG